MQEVYLSTDVETDGPIPGTNSLLSFDCAAYLPNKTLVGTFFVNLEALPIKGFASREPPSASRGEELHILRSLKSERANFDKGKAGNLAMIEYQDSGFWLESYRDGFIEFTRNDDDRECFEIVGMFTALEAIEGSYFRL